MYLYPPVILVIIGDCGELSKVSTTRFQNWGSWCCSQPDFSGFAVPTAILLGFSGFLVPIAVLLHFLGLTVRSTVLLDFPALLSLPPSCQASLALLFPLMSYWTWPITLAVPTTIFLEFPGLAVPTTILLSIGPALETQICLSAAGTRDLEKNQHGAWTEDPEL